MVDTLKLARELQDGTGFTAAQAERLASALAQVGDEKRLSGIEVRLGVQTWISGLQLVLVLAVLWQLFALRGEMSALATDGHAQAAQLAQLQNEVRAAIAPPPTR